MNSTHFNLARAAVARALVRWVSRWYDGSYHAWVRKDRDGAPEWWEHGWGWMAKRAERVALPLARRLDREATGQQMVEECWWG